MTVHHITRAVVGISILALGLVGCVDDGVVTSSTLKDAGPAKDTTPSIDLGKKPVPKPDIVHTGCKTPDDCLVSGPCKEPICKSNGVCLEKDSDVGKKCTDGDPCNGDDACKDGICEGGKPVACDDGNVCTKGTCEQFIGCTYENVEAMCGPEPKEPCIQPDLCVEGKCKKGGGPKDCDDKFACTNDSCDAKTGCKHAAGNDGSECTEKNPCIMAGTCKAGSCIGAKFCPNDKDCVIVKCQGKKGCYFGDNCDDANPCTNDSCDNKLCKHSDTEGNCKIGQQSGKCHNGVCNLH